LDSGPDGGNCPPVGPCRGFEGTCGYIAEQFAELPVLPDFPNGMQDWACTAFPDEENNQVDAFLVGLIAIAIALPVTLFISTCFAIANDSEAPESWLEWMGWRKLVWGRRAHRRWHYTASKGPPTRYVRWFVRSAGAPPSETLANLWRSFHAWVTGSEVPWLVEAREAEEEAEEEATAAGKQCDDNEVADDCASKGGSTTSSQHSARALSRYKRMVAAIGVAGVFITWALFAWFIFTYGARTHTHTGAGVPYHCAVLVVPEADIDAIALPHPPVPSFSSCRRAGMLVYKLLGDDAQASFARSWGISYGMGAAAEWKEILIEAGKGMLVLVIMERLLLTSDIGFFENQLDYLCLQALLFKHSGLSIVQQVRLLFARSKRLQD
jgi:hypothetical protein